jgi:hypothetical protein
LAHRLTSIDGIRASRTFPTTDLVTRGSTSSETSSDSTPLTHSTCSIGTSPNNLDISQWHCSRSCTWTSSIAQLHCTVWLVSPELSTLKLETFHDRRLPTAPTLSAFLSGLCLARRQSQRVSPGKLVHQISTDIVITCSHRIWSWYRRGRQDWSYSHDLWCLLPDIYVLRAHICIDSTLGDRVHSRSRRSLSHFQNTR